MSGIRSQVLTVAFMECTLLETPILNKDIEAIKTENENDHTSPLFIASADSIEAADSLADP